MMSFYDRKGPESWSQGIVPHFITCNSFIGRSYAKVLHGFIRDCMKPDSQMQLDIDEPLYIIELGAGSGKFSFFMLKALDELKEICDFPMQKIVYIMTDFTENNFNFWRDHPSLKVRAFSLPSLLLLLLALYFSSLEIFREWNARRRNLRCGQRSNHHTQIGEGART
jgi:hypothetical protein